MTNEQFNTGLALRDNIAKLAIMKTEAENAVAQADTTQVSVGSMEQLKAAVSQSDDARVAALLETAATNFFAAVVTACTTLTTTMESEFTALGGE